MLLQVSLHLAFHGKASITTLDGTSEIIDKKCQQKYPDGSICYKNKLEHEYVNKAIPKANTGSKIINESQLVEKSMT